MPPSESTLPLVASLADPVVRRDAARRLANHLGAENLLVFIPDAETGVLLPAPGFPQTLPRGRGWRAFLAICATTSEHAARLPFPDTTSLQDAVGIAQQGSVLVLLGGQARLADAHAVSELLPLLTAAFRGEQQASIAHGQVAATTAAAAEGRALALALDGARRELLDALSRAEAASLHLTVLSKASAALLISLDEQEIQKQLVDLAVPALADLCFFDAMTASGEVARVIWKHVDVEQQTFFDQVCRFTPVREVELHPVARALRTREAELVPEVDDAWMQQVATSQEHLAFMRALAIQSALTVPLVANDQVVGALTSCYTQRSGRHHGPADLELAQELGRRAALAIEHSRLHQETQAARATAETALRLRDEFLGGVSHDLRSPLATLYGAAQLLLRLARRANTPETAGMIPALEGMEAAAKKMTAMVQELLDLSQLQAGHELELVLAPVDLVALVQSAVRDAQQMTNRHTLTVQTPDKPLLGRWDGQRLERVLANLLSNAIKYSPNGGGVTIMVAEETVEGRTWATLTVADQGIGIAAEDLPRVFDRFYRAANVTGRFAGTGIGLAGAKQIVEQHGGAIAVDSEAGQGSSFIVRLPIIPA